MMQWGESIRLALDALGVDKVKAFLTMLGVMIGSAVDCAGDYDCLHGKSLRRGPD